jgi:hypothetical protein
MRFIESKCPNVQKIKKHNQNVTKCLLLRAMSHKKTLLFFIYQTIRYAKSWDSIQRSFSYLKAWRQSQQADRNSMSDEWAWINFEALDFLRNWLKQDHKVFEYGGGGSTLFFLKRCGLVCTVEHDEQWFKLLEQKAADYHFKHWQGRSEPGQLLQNTSIERKASNPDDYASNSPQYKNHTFENYVKSIAQYPEEYFDLILVDGRARTSCISAAMPHLKKGGLLVIDNSERSYYLSAHEITFQRYYKKIINQRGPLPYTPDFVNTLVLEKL